MSVAEIGKAVGALSPDELACLAAYIARQDKLARSASSPQRIRPVADRTDSSRGENEQLEQDFSPGGKQPL